MLDDDRETAAPDRRGRRGFGVGLGLVAFGGFLLRAWYIFSVQATSTRINADSIYHYWWPAKQLARGRGFIEFGTVNHCDFGTDEPSVELLTNIPDHIFETCQVVQSAKHPPGFVSVLAGLDLVGISSTTAQRYAMAVLGTVTVVLLGLLVARIVSRRAGIIAAVIAAIYPNTWVNDTTLLSETLLSFGFVLGLVGVYAFWRRPTWQRIVVASVGFTIAASTRPESLLLFGVVIVPLVLARTTLPAARRVGLIALAAVAPLAMVVPWTVYNNGRFAEPVRMSTGFGPTSLAATCDEVYYTDLIGYYALDCTRAVLPDPAPEGLGPDESQVDAIAREYASEYRKAHPARTVLVVAAREARLFEVWNPRQMARLNQFTQGRGSLALTTTAQIAFWALCLAAIAGAVLFRRRRIPLYPLLTQLGITMVVVAMAFGGTRYRTAVEWCLIILAAAALDAGIGRLVARVRRRDAGPGPGSPPQPRPPAVLGTGTDDDPSV